MDLPQTWDLPEEIRERFGQKSSGKQRAMFSQGHLLIVLHKLPGADERQRRASLFWRSPDGNWQSGSGGVGIAPLQKHVMEYDKAEETLELKYQRAASSEDHFEILEELGPVKHAAKNMSATLQSAREAVKEDRDLIDLRDLAANARRNLELLHDDCRNALDFNMARKAEEQARSGQQAAIAGHRLNILAAIFFPLMALSSLLGMNLTHGLEERSPWVFWTVMGAGVALGILIHGWVVRNGPKAD